MCEEQQPMINILKVMFMKVSKYIGSLFIVLALIFPVIAVSEEGTFIDPKTGLVWSISVQSEKTWEEAVKYCKEKDKDKDKDDKGKIWRLPNINELHTILDFSGDDRIFILSELEFGPLEAGDDYWSSTTRLHDAGAAYILSFGAYRTSPSYTRAKIAREDIDAYISEYAFIPVANVRCVSKG